MIDNEKKSPWAVKTDHSVLRKSLEDDDFQYALRLVTGEKIIFSGATKHGEWLHLRQARYENEYKDDPHGGTKDFPRGVDVRISSIVWMADAPFGS